MSLTPSLQVHVVYIYIFFFCLCFCIYCMFFQHTLRVARFAAPSTQYRSFPTCVPCSHGGPSASFDSPVMFPSPVRLYLFSSGRTEYPVFYFPFMVFFFRLMATTLPLSSRHLIIIFLSGLHTWLSIPR